jgi:ABC-type sugar transport system permease subunit
MQAPGRRWRGPALRFPAEVGVVMKRSLRARIAGMSLFLVPGLLLYLVFFLIPALQGFAFSLFRWQGFSSAEFVGLQNYARLLDDMVLRQSLLNMAYLMAVYITLPVILGLFCANLLFRGRVKGETFFRTVFFLPQVFTMTAVGILFMWMAEPNYGMVNTLLHFLHLDQLRRPWLGDEKFAIHAIALMTVWLNFGYVMIILLSGIQKINLSLYEAADLDGTNELQKLLSITVPSLQNEFLVAIILMIINALNTYPLIQAATGGGPGYATMVPAYWGFRVFSAQSNLGYGSTIINVLVLLTAAITLTTFAMRAKEAGQ